MTHPHPKVRTAQSRTIQNKKESIGNWSGRVFGYTKNGYLYVNNKRVKKLERDIDGDHIDDDDY